MVNYPLITEPIISVQRPVPCAVCGQPFAPHPQVECLGVVIRNTVCDLCGEKRLAEGNSAKAAELADAEDRAAARREETWLASCPPLYRDTEPERLPQKALAKVMAWKVGPKGLVLHGPTGKCKTRAAFLLVKRLIMEDKVRVRVFAGNSFAHECAIAFGDHLGEDWVKALVRVDVLFLDDLGKLKLTERVESELFGLIESRAANLKPVLATTNFAGAALTQKLTEDRAAPLVRRLREFCESVAFV